MTNGANLLLLVAVDTEDFGTYGPDVSKAQGTPIKIIAGRHYYQLKCTIITDTDHHLVMIGETAKMYLQEQFEQDFKKSNVGFRVRFASTTRETHVNWKQLVTDPSTYMIFGAPLSVARSFDSILNPGDSNRCREEGETFSPARSIGNEYSPFGLGLDENLNNCGFLLWSELGRLKHTSSGTV